MATLNTLRTRFGVVLSAVIAFALLAFIFSLKSEMGFSGNDPVVAEINGESVTYTEYFNEYNNVQRQSGVSEIDEEQADMLYSATWQALIAKYVLQPGFEELGIDISEAERMAVIRGEIYTQAMYSAFGDPSTGVYNINALNSFLFSSQGNPESEAMWAMLINQALLERAAIKYATLANAGVNVNSLEVSEGVEVANNSYSGRWARKRYAEVSDSLVKIPTADVKKYYEDNKEFYRRRPTRTLSYVEFNIAPSEDDKRAAEATAKDLGARFAESDDIRAFVRENRGGSIAPNYVLPSGIASAAVDALVAGKQYGPESDDANWSMSRVEDSIYASDSLTLSHIVLPYTDGAMADSLLVALRKGSDADFAAAAVSHSVFSESANNGGALGVVPFSVFIDDVAASIATLRKGDIIKVETGDMIQLIKATEVGPRVKHYRVATIDVPIVASQATRNAAYSAAGVFAAGAKGSEDKFKSAAGSNDLSTLTANISPSMRTVSAIDGSQEIARWAHRAKVGDLSEIFKVNDGYVVAMLTSIDDSEFSPLSAVENGIIKTLINDQKFEVLNNQIKGSTFEEKASSIGATPEAFEDVTFGSYYVTGLGVEPAVVGAITSSKAGVVSSPIKGMNAIYVFVVDEVSESEEPQTVEAEMVRAEVTKQQQLQQALFGVLESMADVKDLRGETL